MAAPARLGLTTGSVTVLLDRLAQLGYLTRSPDPVDRRMVIVSATREAERRAVELYGPVAAEGAQMLSRYSEEQLHLLRDFLRRSRELQRRHPTRIRGAG